MKKIFAFAIAIVAMATSMVSCNNDNTDFIEQPAPVPPTVSVTTTDTTDNGTPGNEVNKMPQFDGNIYFAAYEHQNEYINSIYTVQVGDQTVEVNIEELSVATTLPENIEVYFKRCGRKEGFVRPIVYVYQIPAEMSGKVNVTANLTVKEGVELPAVLDVWGGAAVNVHNQFSPRQNIARNAMASKLAEINAQNYVYDVTK